MTRTTNRILRFLADETPELPAPLDILRSSVYWLDWLLSFYEKVIKVKADVAASIRLTSATFHRKVCLGWCVARLSRAPLNAFILTLDSLAKHLTIELGTKRNAV